MQQETTTQIIDPRSSAYVNLFAIQREVSISRGALKKYLTYMDIEPICFHTSARSLYISREAMAQTKRLKRNPALLAQLTFPIISREDSEGKDTSDGC